MENLIINFVLGGIFFFFPMVAVLSAIKIIKLEYFFKKLARRDIWFLTFIYCIGGLFWLLVIKFKLVENVSFDPVAGALLPFYQP